MDNAERKAGLHVRPSGPCPDSNHKIHGRVVRLVDLEELAFVGGDVQMGAYTIVAEWTP